MQDPEERPSDFGKFMPKQEASHNPAQPGRITVGRSSRNTDAIVPLVPFPRIH